MYQDLTKFNRLYSHLLSLQKGGGALEYIECYQENYLLLDHHMDGEENDNTITRKRLVLISNYADNLFLIENYTEAEKATKKALSDFNVLSENERKSTNLYQLMLFNLAQIAFKLGDIETSYSRFKRLYELYPEKGEYLKWLLMLNHQKRRGWRYVLIVLVGVSLAVFTLLTAKEHPVLMYVMIGVAILCFSLFLYIEIKYFQTKKILQKKASS